MYQDLHGQIAEIQRNQPRPDPDLGTIKKSSENYVSPAGAK
jgi:hypothetical protein